MPKEARENESQVTGFDVTVSCQYYDVNQVIGICKLWFKDWVFQKEKGSNTEYLHFQIRGRLFKKKRPNELRKEPTFFQHSHITPTSKNVHSANSFNYVLKEDTRVEGPWRSDEEEEPMPLTRQLKTFMKVIEETGMYEWQKKLYELVQQEDDRTIKVIYDAAGNAGKSIFCEYLMYNKLAFEIPPLRSMEDIMQMSMCIKPQKCYLIDMPRGMKKDKLGEFYSGLECLKNGYMYDKRYSFKMRRIDRPQVVVFTNMLPKMELLSADRWELYRLESGDLVSMDSIVNAPLLELEDPDDLDTLLKK